MSFLFVKRFIALLLSCIVLFWPCVVMNTQAIDMAAEESMNFDCESVILMEANTGTILYEFNADKALPPASVTKIMTLLLVMEEIEKGNLKYSDVITTSAHAASMGGSQVFLKEGEQMTAEDMIKSVVIASANDAAVALAGHICGSEQIFVQRMNDKAKELPNSLPIHRELLSKNAVIANRRVCQFTMMRYCFSLRPVSARP